MHDEGYATTRQLTTEKPACFDSCVDDFATSLKNPGSEQKIAEGGLRLNGFYKRSSDDKPLITVITVVYNGVEYLEDTIRSVIEQDYDNVEYIIVDGGSKDGTLEVIRNYQDAIDYWVSEPDSGIYNAMNKGIALTSGLWVNFMNSGDCFHQSDVISSISFATLEDYSLIYGDKLQNGRIVRALPLNVIKLGVIHACHQSMFFKISTRTKNIINYKESFKIYSDYDLVARLFNLNLNFYYHCEPIAVFQGGGVSAEVSAQKRKDKYLSVFRNFGVAGLLLAISNRIFSGFWER